MDYIIERTNAVPRILAASKAQTSFQDLGPTIGRLMREVYAFLKTAPVKQSGPSIVLYWDDQFNLEAGVEVSAKFEPQGSIGCTVMPSGPAVKCVHPGPYIGIPDAHRAIHAWCQSNGVSIAGPNWEIYGDWSRDESKLRTEIYYLVRL